MWIPCSLAGAKLGASNFSLWCGKLIILTLIILFSLADCTAQDQGNCPAGETAGTETPSGSPCLAAQQMRLGSASQQQLMNVALPTPDGITE